VLVVGYDDLECPFCAQMNAEIFPAILDRYKDQVRVVYAIFRSTNIHPWGDARCDRRQLSGRSQHGGLLELYRLRPRPCR